MNKLYINGTYLKKNPQWHTEDSLWKASQIIKIIENNKLQFQSICEVGCGAGLILVELQKCFAKNIKFYGYDISPQAIELAYKLKNENLNFYLEDFVKKRNQQFDIILCIDVLEHIEDFYGFLKNIKRKGTYKIFHVPLEMNVQKIILQRILKSRKQSGHIHYFMKETALETLRDTGYKVIDNQCLSKFQGQFLS